MTKAPIPPKILFLDIDGVINSERSSLAFGGRPHGFTGKCARQFDWVAVGLVRALCRATGAGIVLSSSWRYDHTAADAAEALDLNIVDATPQGGQSRGMEIDQWLHEHPHVTQYAIVDDIKAFLPEQLPFYVQTDDAEGLTFADYKKLKTLLK